MKCITTLIIMSLYFLVSNVTMGATVEKADGVYEESLESNLIKGCLIRDELIIGIEENGGKILSHEVDRGETWESISKRYGVETTILRALNPSSSVLYVGLELQVPQLPKISRSVENFETRFDARFITVDNYLSAKEWKKAVKILNEILDGRTSLRDDERLTARYMRGLAYFNSKKYDKATDDFEYVKRHDGVGRFPEIGELYLTAETAWRHKQSEKAELFGTIFGAVLQVGAAAANTYFQVKQLEYSKSHIGLSDTPKVSSNSRASYNGVSVYDPNYAYSTNLPNEAEFQNQLQQIMALSYNKVMEAEENEYQMVRQNYIAMGSDISKAEYRAMIGAAIGNKNTQESGDYEPPQRTNDTAKTSTVSSSKCIHCDGTGKVVKEQKTVTFGMEDPKEKCNECGEWFPRSWVHRHYKCTYCNGTGHR